MTIENLKVMKKFIIDTTETIAGEWGKGESFQEAWDDNRISADIMDLYLEIERERVRRIRMSLEISNKDLRDILIYSFRHVLGRPTYAASTVAVILKDNSKNLSTPDLKLYIREIEEEIDSGMCGLEEDGKIWKHLKEWMQLELSRREK